MGKGGPLNKKVHKVCKINLRFSSKKINNLYLIHFLSCLCPIFATEKMNDFSAENLAKIRANVKRG